MWGNWFQIVYPSRQPENGAVFSTRNMQLWGREQIDCLNCEITTICILLVLHVRNYVTYFELYGQFLIYSMEQSPCWQANRSSASQEIPLILWNLKVHYCIYKCLTPVTILNQIDPVHFPISHFLNLHLHIILPPKLGSSKWSFSLRSPHQSYMATHILNFQDMCEEILLVLCHWYYKAYRFASLRRVLLLKH